MLLVDKQGRLEGVVTRRDLLRAAQEHVDPAKSVGEIASRELMVTYPDELVYQAAAKMIMNHIGRLPVVSRDDPRTIAGYLGRAEVLAARMRQMTEEQQDGPMQSQVQNVGEEEQAARIEARRASEAERAVPR